MICALGIVLLMATNLSNSVVDPTLYKPWQADPVNDGGGDIVPLAAGRPLDRAVLAFARAISRGAPDSEDVSLGTDVVRVLSRMEAHIT